MTPIEVIVKELGRRAREQGCSPPRRNGRGYFARCPVHGGRGLQVVERQSARLCGWEGVADLECDAGCSEEDVLAALGLSIEALYGEDAASGSMFPGLRHGEALRHEILTVSTIVEGVIEAGTVGTIAALPETYKSFVAVETACKVAAGGKLLGRYPVTTRGPVGYWWQDDSQTNELRRLQAYARRHDFTGELPIRWHLNEGLRLPDHLDALRDEIEREEHILVVLDSLYNFIGGNLKDEDVALVFGMIKEQVCNPTGCAVLIVDHAPWPTEGNRGQRRAYGSVFKAAAIRWGIYLEREGEKLWIEARGNNVAGFKRTLALWDEEALELRLVDAPEAGVRDLAGEIEGFLERTVGATTTVIVAGVGANKKAVIGILETDERFERVPPTLFGKPKNANCWVRKADLHNLFPGAGTRWEHVGPGDSGQPVPTHPSPPLRGEGAGTGSGAPVPDEREHVAEETRDETGEAAT